MRLWILLGAAFLTFSIGAGFMHAYTVFLVTFVALLLNFLPPTMRAQGMAISLLTANVANLIIAPTLVGWVSDMLALACTETWLPLIVMPELSILIELAPTVSVIDCIAVIELLPVDTEIV